MDLDKSNFSEIEHEYRYEAKNLESDLKKDSDHIYGNQIINISSNQEPTQVNSTLLQKLITPKGVTNSSPNTNSLIGTKTKRSTLEESDSNIKNTKKIFEVTRIKQQTHNDNYRKSVLKAPFDSFIELIEKCCEISDFQKEIKFNLNKVFGGIEKNKNILKYTLREIINIETDNKATLKRAKPKNKCYYNYFLSRSYKFLLHKFYSNSKIFKIRRKKVKFELFNNFDDVKNDEKKAKNCYFTPEFEREKENVLTGFKDLKARKRKQKIFKIKKGYEKKDNKNKKEQFPNENEMEKQEESLQINNNINYFQFDENKDNNEIVPYESERSRDSNNNLSWEDNSNPNIGEVDENNYPQNRSYQEDSESNTHFKRESLFENEFDFSEIIKISQ